MFPQIFGKYVLERELASGGMARVYLATLRGAVGFEKRLVVKQIRPELASDYAFVQRFVEEAKTAVELSHPNIVPVYELGVEQGVYYIAMEFCPGVTLSDVLAETGKLSPEEGAYVGVEICRALDYAHRRGGIVHRDATPRNVLLDEEGAVRLIDFGIALPVTDEKVKKSDVFGSPGHMPPEQLAGKPLTAATDVFAVAALLVEAWSGLPPFRRRTARESHEALYQPLPPLGSYDAKLEPLAQLIAGALAHDPKLRPAQAELFARPLRDFLRSVDSGDVARVLGKRVRRVRRRAEFGSSAERDSLPPSPGSTGSSAPGAASSGSPLTRTFAARGEVQEWTRRPDSVPPKDESGGGPATRKLPSEPPPSTSAPSTPAVGAEPDSADRRRTAVTDPDPLVANDTPPQAVAPRASAPAGKPLRGAGTALAVGALALGLIWVAGAPPRTAAPAEPRAALTSPAPLVTSAQKPAPETTLEPALPARAAPAPVAPPPVAPPPVAPAPVDRAPKLASAAPKSPPASGVLRLTADPAADVSVSGAGKTRALRTPVRELRLPTGTYTVTFRNQTYGAPVVTRVVVGGDRVQSVHADFREADPRVTVR
jgi:serine/threonine-protein kinase